MTDLMKRYEKETGKTMSHIMDVFSNADKHSKEELINVMTELFFYSLHLESQLTWRSAINEPPKNEGQQLCRWSRQDNCHFRHYDLRFGWGNVTEKEIKDLLWLPIPKEN